VKRPVRLAVSMGDPAGVGPELVARALATRPEIEFRVFGDRRVLDRAAASIGVAAPDPTRVEAVTALAPHEAVPGRPDVAGGRAQVAYLEAATRAVQSGEADALVTAPISKEWAGRAGFSFPGHTEYLADAAGTKRFAMMLAGPRLRVTVATTHIALAQVPAALSVEAIATATVLTVEALARDFGVAAPRVAVAGLNPHAGEAGRFGDEETRLVAPAIEAARCELQRSVAAATLTGPHVPDAVFRDAALGAHDAVVALYHDQGLIPVKLLHFDEAVNVTLGLPFVRTSPDHGTAYDLAGSGRARPDSFFAAVDLAAELADHHRTTARNG
jgi:4-hydroxythreonine-4-phosphate dehydrogenase